MVMNVLILTPDAVGSTLLQRLLTIYMQFHEFDQPVINLHELTNGILPYWNAEFNREMLGKPDTSTGQRGYFQTLEEVVNILESVTHYKTARVAAYHIRNRQDTIQQQLPFYNYLNENFFIISCRRQNVFEHGLSWALNKISTKLNVYSSEEKISTFLDMYKNPINVDTESMLSSLNNYRLYLKWCDDHFNIASYFQYDEHISNIEKYILDLPIFAGQKKLNSWQDTFGQEFNDWNRCHFMMADIGILALEGQQDEKLLLSGPDKSTTALSLISNTQSKNIIAHLPKSHQEFLKNNAMQYIQARDSIEKMRALGILTSTVPMKKQTLAEKRHIVKNFNQCVEVYNVWAEANSDIAKPVDLDELQQKAVDERNFWKPNLSLGSSNSPLSLRE
jgi:hypothetical protein